MPTEPTLQPMGDQPKPHHQLLQDSDGSLVIVLTFGSSEAMAHAYAMWLAQAAGQPGGMHAAFGNWYDSLPDSHTARRWEKSLHPEEGDPDDAAPAS